ncbi:ATP-binding protein [Nonomuraea wenchangensis]
MSNSSAAGEVLEPRPEDLIESLRAFGYDLATSLADLVDNSIAAGASTVTIAFSSDPGQAWVSVMDDGHGMSEEALRGAMRFARNPNSERAGNDLGRFGLGLKTASLSQARVLTVLTRTAEGGLASLTWDIDHVTRHRAWLALTRPDAEAQAIAERLGFTGQGTMVLWRRLDKLDEGPLLGRRISDAGKELSLLFHRFIEMGKLKVIIGRSEVRPMDPFLRRHPATQDRGFEDLTHDGHRVRINSVVLPHPSRLTAQEKAVSTGSGGMLARQGLYVYRGNRLIVAGGWLGLGGMHSSAPTRLARVAVEIPPEADLLWDVDVRKSTIRPPAQIEDRIIDLALDARARSERVFTHRGAPVTGGNRSRISPVWQQIQRLGQISYLINRDHPVVAAALAGESSTQLEGLLRLVEDNLPVLLIAQQAAAGNPAVPPVEPNRTAEEILTQFRAILAGLPTDPALRASMTEALILAEPFSNYPGLIKEIIEADSPEEG